MIEIEQFHNLAMTKTITQGHQYNIYAMTMLTTTYMQRLIANALILI